MVLQSSSNPQRQPGPGTEVSGGGKTTHEHLATSHPTSDCSKVYIQLLTRLFGVNDLQCVNIEIVVLISSPVLTAQQGNCCCLYLCKLSLIKPSHKRHRQISSFCNGDVCLFVINQLKIWLSDFEPDLAGNFSKRNEVTLSLVPWEIVRCTPQPGVTAQSCRVSVPSGCQQA